MKPHRILLLRLLLVYAFFSATIIPIYCESEQQEISTSQQLVAAELFHQSLELFRDKQYAQALIAFRQVLEIKPDCVEAYFNIGIINLIEKQFAQAIPALEQVITLNPQHAKAYWFLASAYNEQQRLDKAAQVLRSLVHVEPHNFEARVMLARIAARLHLTHEALEQYDHATQLRPTDTAILFECAQLLASLGRLHSSSLLYRRILELSPSFTTAALSLAHVLRYQGRMKEAIPYYQKTLAEWPDNAQAHCGLAEAYLATGHLTKGWKEFEWRLKNGSEPQANVGINRWEGQDIRDKTILVRAEGSPADMIMHMRYFPLLKERGSYVIVEANESVLPLLNLCESVDELITPASSIYHLPKFDYQVPLLSLPYVFGTSLDTIPAPHSYFSCSSTISYRWRSHRHPQALRVGVSWSADETSQDGMPSDRSIPFDQLEPLFACDGVIFYALEPAPYEKDNLLSFNELYNAPDKLLQLTALISTLDIVITADNTIAHLAGSLGKTAYVLLPHNAHWTWLQHKSNSPWYPTACLMRQGNTAEWNHVIKQLIEALEPYSIAPQSTYVTTEVAIGELVDKITILEIKAARITDPEKLSNIHRELESLQQTYYATATQSKQLDKLAAELKATNEALWDIEDAIRDKEMRKEFDSEFIALARNIYYTNDKRFQVKRAINELLGSRLTEEKSYKKYC